MAFCPPPSGGTDWQAYYDTQLDITWTADGNLQDFDGCPLCGAETLGSQVAWAAGLTINGIGGWRLARMGAPVVYRPGFATQPNLIDCSDTTQAACQVNELDHLFHYGAGTTFGSGVTAATPGPFSGIEASDYWSGSERGDAIDASWVHSMGFDNQTAANHSSLKFAWAVHPGLVPEPSTALLFAVGLAGLAAGGGKRT